MSRETEKVELSLTLHHETDKAILVSEDDINKVWLPLSQIEILHSHVDKKLIEVEMPLWLAEKSKFAGY